MIEHQTLGSAANDAWQIRRHGDAGSFIERAEPWLLGSEAEHNLLLGVVRQLESGRHPYSEPIYLATVESQDSDAVAGCAFRTPPFKFGLTRMPTAAVPLVVREASGLYSELPAVLGPEPAVGRFAELWAQRHAVRAEAGMQQRIYSLATVHPPPQHVDGHLRPARQSDLDWATGWIESFTEDAGVWGGDPGPLTEQLIAEERLFLWEDGEPRSMAAGSADTPHGVRVGYVYTPPAHRKRGYASACVAALSGQYLDRGKRFCFLYTDLANPTSNLIYQRIGYRPVCDVVDYSFA